jgi:hypothetical protein
MPYNNNWRENVQGEYDKQRRELDREYQRLAAGSRHRMWTTGLQDSSMADIAGAELGRGRLSAMADIGSNQAADINNWTRWEEQQRLAEVDRVRREKAAKSAGWWNLAGKVAGIGLSAIPGGGFWGNIARGAGSALTGLPGQAFQTPRQEQTEMPSIGGNFDPAKWSGAMGYALPQNRRIPEYATNSLDYSTGYRQKPWWQR